MAISKEESVSPEKTWTFSIEDVTGVRSMESQQMQMRRQRDRKMKPLEIHWGMSPKACFLLVFLCSCVNEQRSNKSIMCDLRSPGPPMHFLSFCFSGGSAGGFHLKCFLLELNDADYNILYKLPFLWQSPFSDILYSNCQWRFYLIGCSTKWDEASHFPVLHTNTKPEAMYTKLYQIISMH